VRAVQYKVLVSPSPAAQPRVEVGGNYGTLLPFTERYAQGANCFAHLLAASSAAPALAAHCVANSTDPSSYQVVDQHGRYADSGKDERKEDESRKPWA